MNLSQVEAFRQSYTELKTHPAEPAHNIDLCNCEQYRCDPLSGPWSLGLWRWKLSALCFQKRCFYWSAGVLPPIPFWCMFELHMTQGCYSCDEKLFTKLKFTMTRFIKITVASLTVRHNNYNKVVSTIKWANKVRERRPIVGRKAWLRSWRVTTGGFFVCSPPQGKPSVSVFGSHVIMWNMQFYFTFFLMWSIFNHTISQIQTLEWMISKSFAGGMM